jgi:hypothetical protein
MGKILVLRTSEKLDAFFSPLGLDLKELGASLKFIGPNDYRDSYKEFFHPENIVIVEYGPIEKNPEILSQLFAESKAALFLAADFQRVGDRQWELRDVCLKSEVLEGLIDTSREVQFCYPLIRSTIKRRQFLFDQFHLNDFQVNLNRLMELTLGQMRRVKKLYEKLIPLREEKFKGLQFNSKFAAGMNSGGEFFDLIEKENVITFFLSSSQSYLTSSIVLNYFEKMRSETRAFSKDLLEDYLEDLINECRELELVDRECPDLLQVIIVKIDLNRLNVEGFHFGGGEIFSFDDSLSPSNNYPMDENSFEKAYFEFSLSRGDSLIITSPGIDQNLQKGIKEKSVNEHILERRGQSSRDIIEEIFFQLKRNCIDDFLDHDSSMVIIKVDANVIMQV